MFVMNRIDAVMRTIQNMCSKDFTLAKLNDELLSMAMICSLPSEYSNFISSLLLKDKLDKSTVQQAFHTEEIQRHHHSEVELSDKALNIMSKATVDLICAFCNRPGHSQDKCYKYQKAMKISRQTQNKEKAKVVAKQHNPSSVQETAGKVSLQTPHTPQTLNDWNADTGATSHMTPHYHWLTNYKPYKVPIRLADNSIVYSAGVGSVVFNPVIQGKQARPVELTRVLHVPMLCHNLLSVLFLTSQREFKVHIDAKFIYFNLNKRTQFVASITDHNSAFLDGITVLYG